MQVNKTVIRLLCEILSCDPSIITPSFRLDTEAEPIEIAKLAIALEEALGFPLYDEKIAEWHTVTDVCTHISGLLEEGLGEPTERSDSDRAAWYYERGSKS